MSAVSVWFERGDGLKFEVEEGSPEFLQLVGLGATRIPAPADDEGTEPKPVEKMTGKEIDAFAAEHDIDLSEATTVAEKREIVLAATTPGQDDGDDEDGDVLTD